MVSFLFEISISTSLCEVRRIALIGEWCYRFLRGAARFLPFMDFVAAFRNFRLRSP